MSNEPDNEDVEMINREKKLVMDFGLGQALAGAGRLRRPVNRPAWPSGRLRTLGRWVQSPRR